MVERPAAAPMPALEAFPPSVLSLDGAGAVGAGSWLQTDGTVVTVQRAQIRVTATSRHMAAALIAEHKCDFTRILLLNGVSCVASGGTEGALTIQGDVGYSKFNSTCKPPTTKRDFVFMKSHRSVRDQVPEPHTMPRSLVSLLRPRLIRRRMCQR